MTPTIQHIAVDNPAIHACRIRRERQPEDMQAMEALMNAAFDHHDSVSMLVLFDQYKGPETGAGFDPETRKSQFQSLAKVEQHAVAGAPSYAVGIINVMDKITPTHARTFDHSKEIAARVSSAQSRR